MAAAPGAPPPDSALSIETPERVSLNLDIAGMGTRALAYLVDAFILFLFWVTVLFVLSILRTQGVSLADFQALQTLVQAAIVLGIFFLQWGYWTLFETLWGGRSPGKRVLHIRVVKLEGAPEGFSEAALRNLGRLVDFLPVLYATGLTAMMASPRSRRLGDLLAGTVVVRERKVDLSRYDARSSPSASSAPSPAASAAAIALSAAEFELVSGFLARAASLDPQARERVALKLAEPLAKRLPEAKRSEPLAGGAAAEAFLESLVRAGRG
ncbi:MAG: RDD family protein [Myxococcales bacterium]